tara:strand:- start:568 stop:1152 length:585 start_codon:yes stop_codon:yes gene_type:complete
MTPAKTTTKKTTVKVKKAPVALPDLPPNPFTFEIFDIVSKQRTKAKKVEALRKYDHPSLRALFIWNFDESVVSLLPPGEVPYSSMKDEQNNSGTLSTKIGQQVGTLDHNSTNSVEGQTSIRREYKKFYNFLKGGNNELSGLRRETMFIQILQGLHPKEAEILCLVKDKDLETKYKITKENVSQAYPQITWGGRS